MAESHARVHHQLAAVYTETPSGRSGGSIENSKTRRDRRRCCIGIARQVNESIQAGVARTLSTIPVGVSRQMTATEYQVRVAEVLNLFDIEAVGDETGIRYGGEGVELEDQPLEAAIRILIGKRFGIPEFTNVSEPGRRPA